MARRGRARGGKPGVHKGRTSPSMLNGDKDHGTPEESEDEELVVTPLPSEAKESDTHMEVSIEGNVPQEKARLPERLPPSITYNALSIATCSSDDDDDGESNCMVEEMKHRYGGSSPETCESDQEETQMLMPIDIQKMILGEGWGDACLPPNIICEDIIDEPPSVSNAYVQLKDSSSNDKEGRDKSSEVKPESMEVCEEEIKVMEVKPKNVLEDKLVTLVRETTKMEIIDDKKSTEMEVETTIESKVKPLKKKNKLSNQSAKENSESPVKDTALPSVQATAASLVKDEAVSSVKNKPVPSVKDPSSKDKTLVKSKNAPSVKDKPVPFVKKPAVKDKPVPLVEDPAVKDKFVPLVKEPAVKDKIVASKSKAAPSVKDKPPPSIKGKGAPPLVDKATQPGKPLSPMKDKPISTGKEKTSSSIKDKTNSSVKDKTNSSVKDKTNSSVKDKVVSSVKDKVVSSVKDKVVSSVKDKVISSVKEKDISSVQEKVVSSVKDKVVSSIKDKDISSVKEKVVSSVKDTVVSSVKDKDISSIKEKVVSSVKSKEVPLDKVTSDTPFKAVTPNKAKAPPSGKDKSAPLVKGKAVSSNSDKVSPVKDISEVSVKVKDILPVKDQIEPTIKDEMPISEATLAIQAVSESYPESKPAPLIKDDTQSCIKDEIKSSVKEDVEALADNSLSSLKIEDTVISEVEAPETKPSVVGEQIEDKEIPTIGKSEVKEVLSTDIEMCSDKMEITETDDSPKDAPMVSPVLSATDNAADDSSVKPVAQNSPRPSIISDSMDSGDSQTSKAMDEEFSNSQSQDSRDITVKTDGTMEESKFDKRVTRSRAAGKTPERSYSASKQKKKTLEVKTPDNNKSIIPQNTSESKIEVKEKKASNSSSKGKTPITASKVKKTPIRNKAAKKLLPALESELVKNGSGKPLGKLHIVVDNLSDDSTKCLPLKSKESAQLTNSASDKVKPMSPKEMFKKNYTADLSSIPQPDSSDDKKGSCCKADNPTLLSIAEKCKPMSPKEMIKKSYSAEVGGDFNYEPSPKGSIAEARKTSLDSSAKSSSDTSSGSECSGKESKSEFSSQNNMQAPVTTVFDPEKPVKVKSRWRRTSELELVAKATEDSSRTTVPSLSPSPVPSSSPQQPQIFTVVKDDPVVLARLNAFVNIECNEYLTDRSVSKETKSMLCDCSLTKEEINRGEKGCGEDCLNRLLFIECGTKCSLGNLCSNKRFVNREYSKCEIVDTKNKGVGVVSAENLPSNTFIMEYVGEVLGPKDFKRRAKEYAKEKNAHFYFMALKSDSVIDATGKGNVSRFINHSCDPNAETQKWTVNGELRIGFFSKRPIAVGEEITFDYQLQRYGKEAQKCYCGSSNCRGWLGEDPENDEEDEDEDDQEETDDEMSRDESSDRLSAVIPKKERKKERKRDIEDAKVLGDIELEEEIEKLSISGLKNQKQTLALSRMMVRAENVESRSQLLEITKNGDTRCLRLFLDYNGLNLILRWMLDAKTTIKLKHQILEVLAVLPIQNKTMLKDSKILAAVEKWAQCKYADTDKDKSAEDDDSSSPDGSKSSSEKKDSPELDPEMDSLKDPAARLVASWALLKEEFRIPKKQRVEQMKEHEKEANMGYSDPRENQSYYDRRRWRDRKESRFDRVSRFDKEKKPPDDWLPDGSMSGQSHLSKEERRHLFAMRVEQEERERKESERMWWSHRQQCSALGVDPLKTAMFHPPSGSFLYFHSNSGTWQNHPECEDNFGQFDSSGGFGPEGGGNSFDGAPPDQQFINFPPDGPPIFNVEGGNKRAPLLPTPPIPPLGHPSLIHQPPPPNQLLPLHHPPLPHFGPPPPHQGFPPFPPQGPPLPGHPQGPPPHPLPQNFPPNQPLLPGPQLPPGPLLQGPPLPQGPPPHQGPHLQGPHLPQGPLGPPPLLPQGQPPLLPPVGPCGPPIQQQPFPPLLQQPPAMQPPVMQPPLPQAQQPPNAFPPFQQFTPTPTKEEPPPPPPLPACPPPVKLPSRWRAAKDKEGRTYYYHTKTRKSQWSFPQTSENGASDSSSSEESDSSDDDEDDEDEEDSSSENEMDISKSEVNEMERVALKRKLFDEGIDSPLLKKPNDNLVKINIIPRDEVEHVKGITKSKIRDNKEKVKREKLRARRKEASAAAAKCEADTSSVPQRRFKDLFRLQMADVVVACLSQYRKPECKIGRITCTEDFKGLARKLTHFIMLKELKHCVNIKDLQCNDNVKHKARDFIRKYMLKFGPVYIHKDKD